MNRDVPYRIALMQINGIGHVKARGLVEQMGSAEAVLSDGRELLSRLPSMGSAGAVDKAVGEGMRRAEQEMTFVEKHRLEAHCLGDDDYSYRLAECPDAPLVLYSVGRMDLNKGRFVSIVGTRKPTDRGLFNCQKLVSDLAQAAPDVTIVSGLAYGIDVAAHKAAIEAGLQTIAIPGHGLDRIYPGVHRQVAVQMTRLGGMLTEFMSGTRPDAPNFVQRNRIIAGLSDVTVVVESKVKGGSLITAADAFSYSRDVMAFPGRVGDETAGGCNLLIKRNKAALIEGVDDLMEMMNWETQAARPVQTELFIELTQDEARVVSLLREADGQMHINDISSALDLNLSMVSSVLLQMEFKNIVRSIPGGRYRLTAS